MEKSYIVKVPVSTYLEFQVNAENEKEALEAVQAGDGDYRGPLLYSQIEELNFSWDDEDDGYEVKEETHTYEVTIREIHEKVVRIRANNEEEAKEKVNNEEGEVLLETSGDTYARTLPMQDWTVNRTSE